MKNYSILGVFISFLWLSNQAFSASFNADTGLLDIPVLKITDAQGSQFFQLKMTLLTAVDTVYAFKVDHIMVLNNVTDTIDQFDGASNILNLPTLSIIANNQVTGTLNIQLNADLIFDGIVTLSIKTIIP